MLDQTAFAYPVTNLSALPAGDYCVQALFDCNPDLRFPAAPGNLYSKPQKIHFDPAQGGSWKLGLTQQIPPEQLPPDTDRIKFVKIQSKRLSEFYGRPIFLRAGVILPRDYAQRTLATLSALGAHRRPEQPLHGRPPARWVRTPTSVRPGSPTTPRALILLQLDGAGPNGDPYYVNSANNGPFGDALVEELIPHVEATFRAVGQPRARFLSGTSTGGWVCLGLQVFYPDFFNGAWSSCPDPVDFRALELVNIYQDDNAYVNRYGNERPSTRDANGDVKLLMRREVGVENLLGRGNSYTCSGEQWGDWNAVFGPRGADGRPVPLWDPQTGRSTTPWPSNGRNTTCASCWRQTGQTLGPKLRGKLHIAAGEADAYFLNNAVHLLDKSLAKADPPFEGKIVYGLGKGHGWMDLSLRQMLDEMQAAAEAK